MTDAQELDPAEDNDAGSDVSGHEESPSEGSDSDDLPESKRQKTAIPKDSVFVEGKGHSHANHYFGKEWAAIIHDLNKVKPMKQPDGIMQVPHEYQLKGAAQIDWLCRGIFRRALLGDAPGLGKTLQAILAMWLCRDEPGMCLVVCPSSLCLQWVQYIHRVFPDVLRAFWLDDSTTTAHQLLAGCYDIIVCSYEFVDANRRNMDSFFKQVQRYANSPNKKDMPPPQRPTSCLFSGFWEMTGRPWKRVVLDECQVVYKRANIRHQALKKLPAQAFVLLSGTLTHNKWTAFSGHIDFLRGHPFESEEAFTRLFSTAAKKKNSVDKKLTREKMALLQRFLQAFVICRPTSTSKALSLAGRLSFQMPFTVDKQDEDWIRTWTEDFRELKGRDKDEQSRLSGHAFGACARARFAAQHVRLLPTMGAMGARELLKDVVGGVEALGEAYSAQEERRSKDPAIREAWLRRLRELESSLVDESPRLKVLHEVYKDCRSTWPDEKIVIYSEWVRWLDMVAVSFKAIGIDTIRYDGSIGPAERSAVEESFRDGPPDRPLLITAGAGGVGLNIQHASIIIQTEIWWNENNELQAVARLDRQGQDKMVKYIRLFCTNSEIDEEIRVCQQGKSLVNSELMEGLTLRHDELAELKPLLTRTF